MRQAGDSQWSELEMKNVFLAGLRRPLQTRRALADYVRDAPSAHIAVQILPCVLELAESHNLWVKPFSNNEAVQQPAAWLPLEGLSLLMEWQDMDSRIHVLCQIR